MTTPTHAQALRKQAEDARRHLEYLQSQPHEDATARAVDTLCGRIAAWEAGADALDEVERLRTQVAECVRHAQHMNTADAEQEAEIERLRAENERLRAAIARHRASGWIAPEDQDLHAAAGLPVPRDAT
jgi:chromosome segregation ATPase